MTKKRRLRKLEQMVELLQEGEAMLAAGKPEAEVFQRLEIIVECPGFLIQVL